MAASKYVGSELATHTMKDICAHMEVCGACGQYLGTVDGVEGSVIRLAKDGNEVHYLPFWWVADVDAQVHLNKSCEEVRSLWEMG